LEDPEEYLEGERKPGGVFTVYEKDASMGPRKKI
jgi:hypothetical protein